MNMNQNNAQIKLLGLLFIGHNEFIEIRNHQDSFLFKRDKLATALNGFLQSGNRRQVTYQGDKIVFTKSGQIELYKDVILGTSSRYLRRRDKQTKILSSFFNSDPMEIIFHTFEDSSRNLKMHVSSILVNGEIYSRQILESEIPKGLSKSYKMELKKGSYSNMRISRRLSFEYFMKNFIESIDKDEYIKTQDKLDAIFSNLVNETDIDYCDYHELRQRLLEKLTNDETLSSDELLSIDGYFKSELSTSFITEDNVLLLLKFAQSKDFEFVERNLLLMQEDLSSGNIYFSGLKPLISFLLYFINDNDFISLRETIVNLLSDISNHSSCELVHKSLINTELKKETK